MRKVLLATAAFALLGTGVAFASGSDSVLVTTTVPQSCTVDMESTDVTLPSTGASSASTGFSYTCNFTGNVADVTIHSVNGGVDDDGAGGNAAHVYNITSTVGNGSSAADVVALDVPSTALTAMPQSFTLALQAPILVAGTYTDTLSISIAP